MKKLFLSAIVAAVSVFTLAAAPTAATALIEVSDGKYLELTEIPNLAVYLMRSTVDDDVELKLEEVPDKKLLWQVATYDEKTCRVKVEHKKKGIWPFNRTYAEVEIKGLVRGNQLVVLQCGKKSISIAIEVK